jgi:hypothetical protein
MATGRGMPGREIVEIGPLPYACVAGTPVQPRGQIPYPQPVQQGDPTQVTNQLVAAETVTTQQSGMGADTYTESGGEVPLTAYTVSDAMTLYGPVTCRHLPTLLATIPGSPIGGGRWEAVYVGLSTCNWLIYEGSIRSGYKASPAVYRLVGTTLTDITASGLGNNNLMQFGAGVAFWNGKLWFGSAGNRVLYSPDGITWTQPALLNMTTSPVVHDGKLWALGGPANLSVYWTDSATVATATLVASLPPAGPTGSSATEEWGQQLVEWRDGEGNRALWVVTNLALYLLDETVPKLVKVRSLVNYGGSSASGSPLMEVWAADDNAYLTFYDPLAAGGRDTVLQLTGGSRLNVGPTRRTRQGLRDADKFRFTHLVGAADNFLVGLAQDAFGTANSGRATAMGDVGAWHTTNRPLTGGAKVRGGGWGNGKCLVIYDNGQIWSLDLPDDATPPQYAAGRSYDTATVTHELANFTGGVPLESKLVLDVTAMCVFDNGVVKDAPGLPTGATLEYRYRLDGGGVVSLGTLTDTQTAWPAVLSLSNPALYKRGKLLEVLTRGTAATATPIRTAVSWHWQRRERQKFDYTVRIDLNYRGSGREWLGRTAAQQRAELMALANPNTAAGQTGVTTFSYGGGPDGTGPNLTTVAKVRVEVAPVEHPTTGRGEMLVVLRDVTPDPSG